MSTRVTLNLMVLIDTQNGDKYTNKYTLNFECVTVKDRYRHIFMYFNLRLGVVYNVSYNLHTYKKHVGNLLYERNWLPSSVKPFDSVWTMSISFKPVQCVKVTVWVCVCVFVHSISECVEQHHESRSVSVDEEARERAVFVGVSSVDFPSVQLHTDLISHV